MNQLVGKVAVITGGGGGIGGATSRRFVEEGAKVAVLDKDSTAAQTITDELTDAGGQSLALGIDVTDLEGLKQGLLEIEKVLGGVDILVNNAGWDLFRPFLKTDPEFWRKIIDINLIGALNMHHVVLPGMVERGYGRVVSVSSDAGRVGSSGESVYAACKARAQRIQLFLPVTLKVLVIRKNYGRQCSARFRWVESESPKTYRAQSVFWPAMTRLMSPDRLSVYQVV